MIGVTPRDRSYPVLRYFTFLTPIVSEYKQVNAAFQASSPSIGDQHALLLTLYNSMKDWVYAKSGEETNLAEIDYGYKFIHELYKINLSEQQKTDIR